MTGLNYTIEELNRRTYDACQKTLKKAKAKHHKELLVILLEIVDADLCDDCRTEVNKIINAHIKKGGSNE